MKDVNKKDCDPDKIDLEAKSWVSSFVSIYQGKDTTPYIRTLFCHAHKPIYMALW